MAKLIPLLADLNVSPLTVEALQREGWDIVRITQRMPPRTPDRLILGLARDEGKAIVTQDLDFSALLALGGLDRPSLVTLRLSDPAPETVRVRKLPIRGEPMRSIAGYGFTRTVSGVRRAASAEAEEWEAGRK